MYYYNNDCNITSLIYNNDFLNFFQTLLFEKNFSDYTNLFNNK